MKGKGEFLYTLRALRSEMLTVGPDAEEERSLRRHADYLKRLTDEGVVLLFGRTQNQDESTFGLVLLQAESEAAAKEIMKQDPAIVDGLMEGQLYPFRIARMKGRDGDETATHGSASAVCVVCKRGDDAVPLLSFSFQRRQWRICPQHLPVLIHDPTQLAGLLPGAEGLQAADHHD